MFYAILLQLPFTLLAWTSAENNNMFCCQLCLFLFCILCVLIFIVAVVFFQVIPSPSPPPPPTHTHMHTHHDNELCSQKLLLSVQLKNILQAVDHSSNLNGFSVQIFKGWFCFCGATFGVCVCCSECAAVPGGDICWHCSCALWLQQPLCICVRVLSAYHYHYLAASPDLKLLALSIVKKTIEWMQVRVTYLNDCWWKLHI